MAVWWRRSVAVLAPSAQRARSDAATAVVVAVVVAAAAGAAAALPRSLDALTDASLDAAFEDAAVARRSIRVEAVAPTPDGGTADPLADLRTFGMDALSGAGPALREVLAPPQLVLDLPRYQVQPVTDDTLGGNAARLTLRVQEGVEDHLEVVDGRLAGTEVRTISPDAVGSSADAPLGLHDLVLSVGTAERLGLEGRDLLLATPDAEDAIARRTATVDQPAGRVRGGRHGRAVRSGRRRLVR